MSKNKKDNPLIEGFLDRVMDKIRTALFKYQKNKNVKFKKADATIKSIKKDVESGNWERNLEKKYGHKVDPEMAKLIRMQLKQAGY